MTYLIRKNHTVLEEQLFLNAHLLSRPAAPKVKSMRKFKSEAVVVAETAAMEAVTQAAEELVIVVETMAQATTAE